LSVTICSEVTASAGGAALPAGGASDLPLQAAAIAINAIRLIFERCRDAMAAS
jgi:hypothetical protein